MERAIGAYNVTRAVEDYREIAQDAEPKRQEVLRRVNQASGPTHALVDMRAGLLRAVKRAPDLARTDLDFHHLLRNWFNPGLTKWLKTRTVSAAILDGHAAHGSNTVTSPPAPISTALPERAGVSHNCSRCRGL